MTIEKILAWFTLFALHCFQFGGSKAAKPTPYSSKHRITVMAKNEKRHAKVAKGTKSAAKKSTKKSADIQAQAAAAQRCAENAQKTAQPGIIATIMSELTKAKKTDKPVTADEILTVLTKQFPDRASTGMMITVRAQLSRLPKEKDFAIERVRDGRVVRYSAA